MKVDVKLVRDYQPGHPIFERDGRISERTSAGLENVLFVYAALARDLAKQTDDNPANYKIQQTYVVGSGARSNKADSDLDFLLIIPQMDVGTANTLKTFLSLIFFNDRTKTDAIDIYLRAKDAYPERASIDITKQVQTLLNKYNAELIK